MESMHHSQSSPVAETPSYSSASWEHQAYKHVELTAGPCTGRISGNTISTESENPYLASNSETVAGPSYVQSGIDITSPNYLHLPGMEHHHHQQSLLVSGHHSQSFPTAEPPSFSFTTQQPTVYRYVEPVAGPRYGHVSGNTLTQGPSYVQVGIGTAGAEVQNSVPASVSLNPENFHKEERIYTHDLEINANLSYIMESREDIFCNENPVVNSVRWLLTDDGSTLHNAADPSHILQTQNSHFGDSTETQLNAESYDYNTASYSSTHAFNLTYHDGNNHKRYLQALPKSLTSRDSGISSEMALSMSSTLSMKVTNDSCATSISKIKDNVTTTVLKEINYSKVHGISEVFRNSVSDMRKPNDARKQQMNNDCRILPYQITSSDSVSNLAVQKNESGGLSVPGIINTKALTENRNLMQPKSVQGKENAFICQICRKIFNQKDEFRRHEIIYTTEKPFKCCVCEKTFCRKENLRRHHRVHTGEKPFKCDECEKYFTRKDNLETHKMIHTDEKPYKCDVCKKAFAGKGNLSHHKHIHDEEKRFICEVCKKAFNQKGKLRRHKRIHAKEKPFDCDICHNTFVNNEELDQHKKGMHGDE